jgi:tetratricopeptide (TPR) repeat protein
MKRLRIAIFMLVSVAALFQAAGEQAWAIDSGELGFYLKRGGDYLKKNELDYALADFNTLIRLDPNYAQAYNGRGQVYQKKGALEKALTDFDRALRLNPTYGEAQHNRDVLLAKREQTLLVREDFARYADSYPDHAAVENSYPVGPNGQVNSPLYPQGVRSPGPGVTVQTSGYSTAVSPLTGTVTSYVSPVSGGSGAPIAGGYIVNQMAVDGSYVPGASYYGSQAPAASYVQTSSGAWAPAASVVGYMPQTPLQSPSPTVFVSKYQYTGSGADSTISGYINPGAIGNATYAGNSNGGGSVLSTEITRGYPVDSRNQSSNMYPEYTGTQHNRLSVPPAPGLPTTYNQYTTATFLADQSAKYAREANAVSPYAAAPSAISDFGTFYTLPITGQAYPPPAASQYSAQTSGNYGVSLNYVQTVRVDPVYSNQYVIDGIDSNKIGNYSKAVAMYSEALKLNPANAVALNNRGVSYALLGDNSAAFKDFNQALSLNPFYIDAKNNRNIIASRM